jgi:hypothetical protein
VEGSTSSGVGGGLDAEFGASALAAAGTGLADAGFDRKVHLLEVESVAGRWRHARRGEGRWRGARRCEVEQIAETGGRSRAWRRAAGAERGDGQPEHSAGMGAGAERGDGQPGQSEKQRR